MLHELKRKLLKMKLYTVIHQFPEKAIYKKDRIDSPGEDNTDKGDGNVGDTCNTCDT